MVLGKQYSESASHATATMTDVYVPSNDCDRISNKSGDLGATTEKTMHFIAEVTVPTLTEIVVVSKLLLLGFTL